MHTKAKMRDPLISVEIKNKPETIRPHVQHTAGVFCLRNQDRLISPDCAVCQTFKKVSVKGHQPVIE